MCVIPYHPPHRIKKRPSPATAIIFKFNFNAHMRCHSGYENIFIQKIPNSGCKNINTTEADRGDCHAVVVVGRDQQGFTAIKYTHTQRSISLFILRHRRQVKPTLTNDCTTSTTSSTCVNFASSPTVCVNLRLHIYSFSTGLVGVTGRVCSCMVCVRQCYSIYK